MKGITQTTLKEMVDYCPISGVFRNKAKRSRAKAGAVLAGSATKGYRQLSLNGVQYRMHRLAWLYVYGDVPEILDHVNGVRTDNRIENLRPATPLESAGNRGSLSNNTTGRKGVSVKDGRYYASITINGKHIALGRFALLDDAAKAYADATKDRFGDYARVT